MKYVPDKYYHAYNRGAHQEKIFFQKKNYSYLVGLFSKYFMKYRVTVACYCLMPNHYHLILRQNDEGSIGMFLKTVFNTYTQAINNKYGKSGTLFQGQVHVKNLDSDSYLLQAIRYIHINPCIAGLVRSPEEWEFSDYLEWIGLKKSVLMEQSLRAAYFRTPLDYRSFVVEHLNSKRMDDMKDFLEG